MIYIIYEFKSIVAVIGNHSIKEENDQKKIMRTAVTTNRKGDEIHVRNKYEAYPMDLRARLLVKIYNNHV